ncbi:MAG: hypothetical protein HEQ35_23660 [Gloeotrichia echinulata IR180]
MATLIPLLPTFAAYAQTDEPLCYIKTGSGTTFNLSSICGGGNGHINLQPIVDQQEKLYLQDVHLRRKGDLTDMKMILSGKIVNGSNDTQSIVGVEYQTYRLSEGKLVKVKNNSLVAGYNINPGESESFEFEYDIRTFRFDVITLKVKSEKIEGDNICFGNTVEKREYCKRISNYVSSF